MCGLRRHELFKRLAARCLDGNKKDVRMRPGLSNGHEIYVTRTLNFGVIFNHIIRCTRLLYKTSCW